MRDARWPGFVVAFVALAAGPGRSHAQSSPDRQNEARVRALFQTGSAHYELHEYDEAIVAFREAYRLSQAPGFLYNIAQSYRLKGDCELALKFYRDNLRLQPEAQHRNQVRQLIREMETCIASRPPQPTEPKPIPTEPKPMPAPIVASAPRVESPGRGKLWTGIVVSGIGVASLGIGTYYGLEARARSNECTTEICPAMRFPMIEDEGHRADRYAKMFWIAGGVVLIGGVVVAYLGARERSTPSIAITPGQGGIEVAWSGWF